MSGNVTTSVPLDFVPASQQELARCLADPMWRLCSGQLYRIMVKSATPGGETNVPFKPNRAQRKFVRRLWTRNVILKARQLGFTTLVAIMWLDHALFNSDQRCVIIAQDREKAEEIFRDKVRFAYDRLPEPIRAARPAMTESKSELLFDNNSSVKVTISARGGTTHRLHISEYGKICKQYPEKAAEIQTGSFPSVPIDGITIVESTAEGQDGDFFAMTEQAMASAESSKILTPRDYRFHFYPWWEEPGYRMTQEHAVRVVITAKEHEYFDEVQAVMSCVIDNLQRAWYVATREGDFKGDPQKMWQEYPSTPREAFQQSTEGFYFARQLSQVRTAGRIGSVPYVAGYPVNTFWDIGHSDGTAVWLHQHVGLLDRFIGFVEGWEQSYGHFTGEMQRWAAKRDGVTWGAHYLPHDADHKVQLGNTVTTPIEELRQLKLGGTWKTVDRVSDLQHGIQLTRDAFSRSAFDETECKAGLAHLAGYRKSWNRTTGRWSDEPLKNEHTEAADAYRQFAQGYHAPAQIERERRRKRERNWKTA